jgi:PKD repeat protein/glucose/arabinose dehydrogenase
MNCTNNFPPHKRVFTLLPMLLFLTLTLSAQLPSGFTDAKIQSGYTSPMGIVFSKNGQKMFVWEKVGKLWCSVWNGTAYIKQATPALDISEEVADWRDFGLQSVALDPNFDANGLIYIFYQVDRHHLMKFGTPQYNATQDEYFNASISRLTRYKLTAINGVATVDLTSRKILLGETRSTGVPLLYESHAGGQILFATDGTLLVTTGDNASFVSSDMGSASETYWQQAISDSIMRPTENVGSFRSQLINSFCGKLLRLDPNTGDAIASNPYYDAANPRSAKSRTWALGFRNPYRMTFKTGTGSTNPADANPGTFIIGDVQNGTWEEVHIVEKGGVNCGWPLYEGITPQFQFYDSGIVNPEEVGTPTFQILCATTHSAAAHPVPSQRRFNHAEPALDWRHNQNIARYPDYSSGTLVAKTIGSAGAVVAGTPFGGNCVTSGTFYTGTAFPPAYRNVFFFADYGVNWIKAAGLHDNSPHQVHEVLDFAPEGYGKGVVDIEYCPLDESLFYVNINTGDIQKISFGRGNHPPKAVAKADKTSGVSPLTVNLSSIGTVHPDGKPLIYNWNFGDGTPNSNLPNPTHIFSSPNSRGFTVTLTVTDTSGLTDVQTLVISTNNTPPSVKITNPTNNSTYGLTAATQKTLQSAITDNDVSGMLYAWQVTLRHNNHEHREPVINQPHPTIPISPVGCDGETYYFLIELTVTDNGGLTAKDSVKIYPDCASINPSVTNLRATPMTNAVSVLWTNPTIVFDEVMVVAKANSGFSTVPNNLSYTPNRNFTGNGSAFEGGKVVYRSHGTSVIVSNLTAGTRYFFRVFTRKGTAWNNGVEISAIPTSNAPPVAACTADKTSGASPLVVKFSSLGSYDPEGSPLTYAWNFGDGTTSRASNPSHTFSATSSKSFAVTLTVKDNNNLTGTKTSTISVTVPQNLPVTNLIATAQTNAADVRWTNPTSIFDEIMVVAKANSGFTTTPTGTNFTANNSFTGNGSSFEGGKVLYRGLAASVNAINLTGGIRYYFHVYTRRGTTWNSGVETSIVPNSTTVQLGCLKGTYFNNTSLSGTVQTRAESGINYAWGTAAPMSGVNADNFSVRWEGSLIPPKSGTYTFTITADNGVRLWVNNTQIINKWFDQNTATYSATISLSQNQNVPIRLEYYSKTGSATAKLSWTIPNELSRIVAFSACPLPAFDANLCYRLTNRSTTKVLEVPDNSLTNGTQLKTKSLVTDAKRQLWRIKDLGDGSQRLVNANSGKSALVLNASSATNAAIVQWDWQSSNNQRWIFNKNTEGYYQLKAKHSNMAMDALSSSSNIVVQNNATTTANQQFKVEAIGCPSGVAALESANILTATGHREGKKAVIRWVSDANDNTDYFMVQKLSANEPIFERVETLNAQTGSTGDKKYYSVEDNQPYDSENFYRVVLYRKGEELPQYSDIISLDFSFLYDFMLFPNPSNDYVDIDLEGVRYRSVVLTIFDASGKVLKEQKIESAPIAPVRINLEGIETGQYFLRIEAEGKREIVKKLTIVR